MKPLQALSANVLIVCIAVDMYVMWENFQFHVFWIAAKMEETKFICRNL